MQRYYNNIITWSMDHRVKVLVAAGVVLVAGVCVFACENKVRMDVALEVRKLRRTETSLEAARESVASRSELVRIIGNEVEAKTAYQSALKDAEAQFADAKAQLFEAQMQRASAQAELIRTEGR
jgi:outer membrane protein TolC